jgi:MFS family permease
MFLLWALLFFGACIMPTATGIIVDCVPRELQAATSSFSQLLYNIFGFFLAPFLSALIMDRFGNGDEGLIWGFYFHKIY